MHAYWNYQDIELNHYSYQYYNLGYMNWKTIGAPIFIFKFIIWWRHVVVIGKIQKMQIISTADVSDGDDLPLWICQYIMNLGVKINICSRIDPNLVKTYFLGVIIKL